MNNIATQGLTREQIMALGSTTGMTNSLQETVLAHFDDIDTYAKNIRKASRPSQNLIIVSESNPCEFLHTINLNGFYKA